MYYVIQNKNKINNVSLTLMDICHFDLCSSESLEKIVMFQIPFKCINIIHTS